MKLSTTDIANLTKILSVCDLVGISAIAFDDGKVSGINDDKSCVILSSNELPKFDEGLKLGLTRLKLLKSRMDLFSNDPKFSIETKEKSSGEISQLDLKGSSANVSFRATSINTIKYPKAINDEELKKISINKSEASLILNAGKAMDAANITINIDKKNQVTIEFTDTVQDTFNLSLSEKAESVNESDSGSCTNYYPFKVFAPLLKAAFGETGEVVHIYICGASAKIIVLDHEMRLMAQTS